MSRRGRPPDPAGFAANILIVTLDNVAGGAGGVVAPRAVPAEFAEGAAFGAVFAAAGELIEPLDPLDPLGPLGTAVTGAFAVVFGAVVAFAELSVPTGAFGAEGFGSQSLAASAGAVAPASAGGARPGGGTFELV